MLVTSLILVCSSEVTVLILDVDVVEILDVDVVDKTLDGIVVAATVAAFDIFASVDDLGVCFVVIVVVVFNVVDLVALLVLVAFVVRLVVDLSVVDVD